LEDNQGYASKGQVTVESAKCVCVNKFLLTPLAQPSVIFAPTSVVHLHHPLCTAELSGSSTTKWPLLLPSQQPGNPQQCFPLCLRLSRPAGTSDPPGLSWNLGKEEPGPQRAGLKLERSTGHLWLLNGSHGEEAFI
jgi:hypothetical protein